MIDVSSDIKFFKRVLKW